MKDPLEFVRRRTRQTKLYLQVWLSVVMVRIRLSSKGYEYFERCPVKIRPNKADLSPAYLARIVKRVSFIVPGALCLAQAVSAQRLLAKFGFDSTMRIGMKSDEDGSLLAHAWLLFEERIVLGGDVPELEKYQVMTDMKSATI